jgi:hypothetical protein
MLLASSHTVHTQDSWCSRQARSTKNIQVTANAGNSPFCYTGIHSLHLHKMFTFTYSSLFFKPEKTLNPSLCKPSKIFLRRMFKPTTDFIQLQSHSSDFCWVYIIIKTKAWYWLHKNSYNWTVISEANSVYTSLEQYFNSLINSLSDLCGKNVSKHP